MTTNVYMPIEVAKREALPKSFLACILARKGMNVYLFEDYIFDKYGYPGPGIYLGKNIFKTERPYSLRFYDSIKNQGIDLFYLDEEGGVYGGKDVSDWEKALLGRVDPGSFDANDYYLSWGEWQAAAVGAKSLANVIVTGSPNYEICKSKYADSLQDVDVKVTKGKKHYILVNTRFSTGNPQAGIESIIGQNSPSSKEFTVDHYLRYLAADMQYIGYFVNLIIELSLKFEGNEIIIRPHPAEDSNFYKILFASHKNVTVDGDGHISSWLRESVCIIHNGCSTAIQAIFSGKPVITYLPTVINAAEMGLTNSVGLKASTVDKVLELVDCALRGGLENPPGCNFETTISNKDAFEEISEIIMKNQTHSNSDGSQKMLKISAQVRLNDTINSLRRRMSVFDIAEFRRLPSYILSAAKYYECQISIEQPCNGVYKVISRK